MKKLSREIALNKDPFSFWSRLSELNFKAKSRNVDIITQQTWFAYLAASYPATAPFSKPIITLRDPVLDSEITMNELVASLNKCKLKKSPGPDGITTEFLKFLPENWLNFILNLFNKILTTAQIPSEWGEIAAKIIPKIGDLSQPENYRCIALINNLPKSFTQVLNDRLTNWSEVKNVIPEFQSGFRKNRGCTDNIFVFNSAIQIKLRNKGGKLYAVFVDFQRAFDLVNHRILFQKLYDMGISQRIISVLMSLYENARICMETPSGRTESVSVTRGVLQGERLSPLLFSLFLADLENYFISRGSSGVSLDNANEINLIAYADDIVLLSDTPSETNNKLRILQNYCEINDLTVNKKKTKVVIFHKGRSGNIKQRLLFHYNDSPLEIVSDYKYLGITFSENGLFNKACKTLTNSSRFALGRITSILKKIHLNSWETRINLFQALLLNVLLYESGTWALRHLEEIDKVQNTFFKRILNAPMNTAGYALRLETGRLSLHSNVLQSALKWCTKIANMPDYRLPKICAKRLERLANGDPASERYNWFSQIRNLCLVNEDLNLLTLDYLATNSSDLLDRTRLRLYETDLNRLSQTSSLQLLPLVPLTPGPQVYLTLPGEASCTKLTARVRLANSYNCSFFRKGRIVKFDIATICPRCISASPDTIYHTFIECEATRNIRLTYLGSPHPSQDLFVKILCPSTLSEQEETTKFIQSIFDFVLNF